MSRLILLFVLALLPTACSGDELEKALQAKVTLVVERDDFANVVKRLEAVVQKDHPGFAIKTSGNDLMFEGITRNQAIVAFRHKEQTVADILTALAVAANPITVKTPSERDQKLLWIITADPDDAKRQVILFTTRAAAEKRGDKLPKAFQPPK